MYYISNIYRNLIYILSISLIYYDLFTYTFICMYCTYVSIFISLTHDCTYFYLALCLPLYFIYFNLYTYLSIHFIPLSIWFNRQSILIFHSVNLILNSIMWVLLYCFIITDGKDWTVMINYRPFHYFLPVNCTLFNRRKLFNGL